MHFSFLDKTLQAKLQSLKKPPSASQSSINFFNNPISEKKTFNSNFFIPPNFSSSCEKFSHRSFDKPLDKTPSTVKRPQSSHNSGLSQSKDLNSIEKDIENLKKENRLVSKKLDRFIQDKNIEKLPFTHSKKTPLFTFMNMNNQGPNQVRSLIEENVKLEKMVKRANSKLDDRKTELVKVFSLLKEKEEEIRKFEGIKNDCLKGFEEIEGKFQIKLEILESELNEKEMKLQSLQMLLKGVLRENNALKEENNGLCDREKGFKRTLSQYALFLNKKDQELMRLKKDSEDNKKLNEEEFKEKNEAKVRGIFAELMNVKLEKKSLSVYNIKLKEEIQEKGHLIEDLKEKRSSLEGELKSFSEKEAELKKLLSEKERILEEKGLMIKELELFNNKESLKKGNLGEKEDSVKLVMKLKMENKEILYKLNIMQDDNRDLSNKLNMIKQENIELINQLDMIKQENIELINQLNMIKEEILKEKEEIIKPLKLKEQEISSLKENLSIENNKLLNIIIEKDKDYSKLDLEHQITRKSLDRKEKELQALELKLKQIIIEKGDYLSRKKAFEDKIRSLSKALEDKEHEKKEILLKYEEKDLLKDESNDKEKLLNMISEKDNENKGLFKKLKENEIQYKENEKNYQMKITILEEEKDGILNILSEKQKALNDFLLINKDSVERITEYERQNEALSEEVAFITKDLLYLKDRNEELDKALLKEKDTLLKRKENYQESERALLQENDLLVNENKEFEKEMGDLKNELLLEKDLKIKEKEALYQEKEGFLNTIAVLNKEIENYQIKEKLYYEQGKPSNKIEKKLEKPNFLSLDSFLETNTLIEELNTYKNSLIALQIENSNLKESSEMKSKKLEETLLKLKEQDKEKEVWISRIIQEKEELINKMQEEQKAILLMNERIKAEFEQKVLESNRNNLKTTERENYEVELESHRVPIEEFSKGQLDTNRKLKEKEVIIPLEDLNKECLLEKTNSEDFLEEIPRNNKEKHFFLDLRQSLDLGLEQRLKWRNKMRGLLLKIYEKLLNEILCYQIREERFEELFKQLDERTLEHVKKVFKKLKGFIEKVKENEKECVGRMVSLMSLQNEWENEPSIQFFADEAQSPIMSKFEKVQRICEENKELQRINMSLEAQVQALNYEIMENESNEDKYQQQVNIMKQEVQRLELAIKENDLMYHEKKHIKTNLIKFLETAGGKKYIESEEYLKVLFSMLDVRESERELLIQSLSGKSNIDKKKGLISILFKR